MEVSDRFGSGFLKYVTITFLLVILILQTVGSSKRDTSASAATMKSSNQPSSSEEEDNDETNEARVVTGFSNAGISLPSDSKCLGQDMRLEKMIQITEHCEKETGEGKNATEAAAKSLSLCFTACIWKYLRLIGADMMFTSEMDSMVIDLFPPVAHGMVMKAVRGCAKVAVLPLSKVDNCTSFGPIKNCILRAVQNICSGNY